jgi:3-hydroxybutyryl-CoA dehydrogenase
MQILVIGNESNLDELKQKFGLTQIYSLARTETEIERGLSNAEIVFDFIPDKNTMTRYAKWKHPLFLNTSFATLSELIGKSEIEKNKLIVGFCGLPTFFNRPVLEVTAPKSNLELLRSICDQLKTDYVCVEDRVGLVTARVICMIINEAYCALEEGIASRNDIDLAMKLGTNYPFGPFEWANQIGLTQVINLLDAVYLDTQDVRYNACNLLRSESKTL